MERNNGKIDLAVVYAPKSLEANLMRLTLGRLLTGCDETRPEGYLSVLEARGTVTEMYKNPNWDAHLINKEMIEMLWKDCADTAERIDTNAFDRFPEEHRWGMKLLGESIMGFGYGCVLYYATIADQSQPRRQNSEAEEKTADDVAKTESNADGEAEAVDDTGTVTYRRVQGGNGNNASRVRIEVNEDGTIRISDKDSNLSISIDNGEHAEYFLNKRGGDAQIVEVDVPRWFDDFLQENTIPQVNYTTNPLNQCGTAPKITDITTPGNCFELPAPWIEWLEEYGSNARIINP